MKISEILAVAGKPGLFKVLASGSASIVVESMIDQKRSSVPGTARVSNLGDITMYTDSEDVPLCDILNRINDAQMSIRRSTPQPEAARPPAKISAAASGLSAIGTISS